MQITRVSSLNLAKTSLGGNSMLDSRLHQLAIDVQQDLVDERTARLNLALADLAANRRARVLEAVTVRLAAAADSPALNRLAQLDSASAPSHPILLAELSGQPVAAVSLADGVVIADPFVPTAEVVALLKLRARQLRRAGTGAARAGVLRRFRRAALGARA
jgi:hypothetical protein